MSQQEATDWQLWQYKRLHIEYCYMALGGSSRSFLCLEPIRGISGFQSSSPAQVPPCLPAPLDSLDPTTTQLPQKAQSQHLDWGRRVPDNGKAELPQHNKSFASHLFWLPVNFYLYHSSSLSISFVLSFTVFSHPLHVHSLSSIGQCKWHSASDNSLGDDSISLESLSQFDVLGL